MADYSVRPVNIFADFMAGREAAHSERAMRNRNALADIDIQREQGVNRLMQNPQASAEDYARAGRSDIGNAITNQRQFEQTSKLQAVQQLGSVAQKALSLDPQTRRAFLQQAGRIYGSAFQALGADATTGMSELQNLPEQELEQRLQQVAAFGPALKQSELKEVSPGGTLYDPTKREAVYTAPGRPDKSGAQWRYLTPDEIKQRGLPEGTSAQLDTTSGKVDILNKREGLSAAEQKLVRDAKMKMPRLNATVRRVERIGEALKTIKKNWAADGGRLDQHWLGWTKEGQELEAAVAQLVPELTALTRTPGVGSQSDLETRLANLALPGLNYGPDVNERSFNELKTYVDDLQQAYGSIVAGGQQGNSKDDPLGIR
jgi:hypothetical protein